MSKDEQYLHILQEIHAQNIQLINHNVALMKRIDELENTATKRGALAGAVAGTASGLIVTVGVELIKAKFGM